MAKFISYDINASKERLLLPFEKITNFLSARPNLSCFIFAVEVGQQTIDRWGASDVVNLLWVEDVTPEKSISDLLLELAQPERKFKERPKIFAAVAGIKLPISAERLCELYYLDGDSPGAIIIGNDAKIPDGLVEKFRDTIVRKYDDGDGPNLSRVFVGSLFDDWGLLSYVKSPDRDEMMGPKFRMEYIFVLDSPGADQFVVDWGKVEEKILYDAAVWRTGE